MRTKQRKVNEPVMNYNIRFPQSLYQLIKQVAFKENKSLALWINEALEKVVKEKQNDGQ